MIREGPVGRIYLWEAGSASGTAGSMDEACAMAGAHMGAAGLVEEADVILTQGKDGTGAEYRRTGTCWRGRPGNGGPVWEQSADVPGAAC